ncbi:aminoacyl-tRNA deacylase [Sphaerobacter sp.]|uniref:aminoacyl-tRNA deacylase n=1 Tax=Sphaerobacter sp. TaxID=2099654 RepID=UPI001DD0D639|nr:YbaK/EbsC family protein [Sphaerobacter sp.]MBX5443826.1 YbaK/EbsC family protein [Sphaerobacter sp.]
MRGSSPWKADGAAQPPNPGEGPQTGPDRLARYLAEHGVDAEILFPDQPTPTVPLAAEALGVPPDQIVKSLLFQGKDGDCVLAIVRGTARVSRARLAAVTGLRQPKLAPPQVVRDLTGYEPGGTPPVGHLTPVPVVVDRAVLDEAVVFGGGGSDRTMLRIRPHDIVRLTRAVVADLCDEM